MPSFADQMAANTAKASADPGGQWVERQVQGVPCTCCFQRSQYSPVDDYSPGVNEELWWFRCQRDDWPGQSLPVPDMQVSVDGAWYVIRSVVNVESAVEFWCERNAS